MYLVLLFIIASRIIHSRFSGQSILFESSLISVSREYKHHNLESKVEFSLQHISNRSRFKNNPLDIILRSLDSFFRVQLCQLLALRMSWSVLVNRRNSMTESSSCSIRKKDGDEENVRPRCRRIIRIVEVADNEIFWAERSD